MRKRLIRSLIELNVVQRLAIALFDPGLLIIVLRRNPTVDQKVRRAILNLPRSRREMLFFGRFIVGRERYCPLCQSQVRLFLPFGNRGKRPNAWCPGCGSLERHRLAWMVFEQKTNLFDPFEKSLLHIAPEPVMRDKFRNLSYLDYLSADLSDPWATVKMDITDIPYPDNAFNVIYCSHVLEHIPNDRQAMRELYRVLKPNGVALFMVPVTREKHSKIHRSRIPRSEQSCSPKPIMFGTMVRILKIDWKIVGLARRFFPQENSLARMMPSASACKTHMT
jgi:hypothetical protein